ncbi:MAG: diguanylate cyclase [Betaproteobacteria bacterium]|nr:diguanylate cyclase [Betaproteobacteria bacterium]
MDDAAETASWLPVLEALRERIRRQHFKPDRAQLDAALAPLALARAMEEAIRLWLQAAVHLAESRPAAAEKMLRAGLAGIDRADHADLAATLEIDLADACHLQNRYADALVIAHGAAHHWRSRADVLREAHARSWVGLAHTQLGRYQEAIACLYAVLQVYTDGDIEYRASRVINCLAIVHEELGDYARAFAMYERAMNAAQRDEDPDMQGRALANWGDGEVNAGDLEKGVALLERAIDVLQGIGAYWHSGWCQLAVGRAHMKRGDLNEALNWARIALASVQRGDSVRMHIEVHAGLGEILDKMSRHDEAEAHLLSALRSAIEADIEREVFKTHLLLSQHYKGRGLIEKALAHHELFFEARARVYDHMVRDRMDSLRVEAELERARREAELHQLKNVQLVAAFADVQRLNRALEDKARAMEELSQRDALTGLYNRRFLHARMSEEIQRLARYATPFSLAVYDIDRFKEVNDRHSHAVGDKVLATLAQVVGTALRESDRHVRFGGEEFAILLPETPLEAARVTLEKLRLRVAEHDWQAIAPGIAVTVSTGVAEAQAGETMEELFDRADALLYRAKRTGRNRVCV